ncbi:DUF4168 domain-containing protein [Pseudanabaena minima]|uniref:DUF4168 domain-containing protein n=1 Tax=Pseudanabaena minima TaxID=890415 RepID=UPI003DA80C69
MNSWHQRHLVYLKRSANKPTQNLDLTSDQSGVKNHFKKYLGQSIGTVSLFGLCMVIGIIIEPMISGNRIFVFAENCVKPSSLQNFLTKVTFGEDHIDRYAAAANAIENKRLEIFRAAKSNPNWSTVANLAESKQTKVCDLTAPPEFLQTLCDQLRSYSEEEICRHGFTAREFNQITLEQKQNPQLRSLIQSKQIQLRGGR